MDPKNYQGIGEWLDQHLTELRVSCTNRKVLFSSGLSESKFPISSKFFFLLWNLVIEADAMAFEPARKICLHFWPQKASELLQELNVPLGNLIRCFLLWLPKQNQKLGTWQKSASLKKGRQELGEGKAQKCMFAASCIIAALEVSICHGNSGCRDGRFRLSKAHYIYKSSGEMSQQDSDVITTRKCIFKKMGPWLNCVHQGISQQKASLITFLKSLLHFQLYKNWVITVFNYLLAPTWLMSFTPIALWTVGEKRWSGSTL